MWGRVMSPMRTCVALSAVARSRRRIVLACWRTANVTSTYSSARHPSTKHRHHMQSTIRRRCLTCLARRATADRVLVSHVARTHRPVLRHGAIRTSAASGGSRCLTVLSCCGERWRHRASAWHALMASTRTHSGAPSVQTARQVRRREEQHAIDDKGHRP